MNLQQLVHSTHKMALKNWMCCLRNQQSEFRLADGRKWKFRLVSKLFVDETFISLGHLIINANRLNSIRGAIDLTAAVIERNLWISTSELRKNPFWTPALFTTFWRRRFFCSLNRDARVSATKNPTTTSPKEVKDGKFMQKKCSEIDQLVGFKFQTKRIDFSAVNKMSHAFESQSGGWSLLKTENISFWQNG